MYETAATEAGFAVVNWLLSLILAAVVALLLTPAVAKIAPRIGAVDRPSERRTHRRTTPTAGGLAIFAAFWLVVAAIGSRADIPGIGGLFWGSVLLLAVCLVDDICELPAAPRLIAQIAAALIAVYGGVRIEGITNPLALWGGSSYLPLDRWAGPLTVLWIVFMINAINWLDGLDGLVAGLSALAAGTFMIMAITRPMPAVAMLGAAATGACLGFLRYNFTPARIFMGDTGSMFLGYLLACIAVVGAFKSAAVVAVLVPLLIMGVPIYDTFRTTFQRMKNGKPIYNADRTHLHHRLLDRGLSVTQTVLLYYGITAVLCLVALGLWLC